MTKHIPTASALTGWRKSSYSGNQNGSCVEVVDGFEGGIPVRDSKDPDGPALLFPAPAWSVFLADVKAGRFTV
ncbi:DUF397 domain-containing protein [Actinacidiphila yeochonensis]|uniref:DUF397 domain-containing protein n=1 Tax=Actinacidiphila yeochonensis TaxID=89050 RepID=UPI00056C15B4|nr:DUF397 domain-containing protein [Actinacidiphila yeochonensis]